MMRRETNTRTLFRTLLSTQLRQKMENNPFITSYNKTSTSSTIIDFPSQAQEGVLLVSAFIFETVMIVGGNLLTIILFVREKKLRKKSLFLVMNMALADVMLGAVSLPLFVYLFVGPYYHLWAASKSTGDLINANFAFKYLYRHEQKFANKRLCIYTE